MRAPPLKKYTYYNIQWHIFKFYIFEGNISVLLNDIHTFVLTKVLQFWKIPEPSCMYNSFEVYQYISNNVTGVVECIFLFNKANLAI